MACAQATAEVDVPLRAAYDAWADPARFPQFVGGVQRCEPIDDVTWRMHGAGPGGQRTWTIRMAERVEDDHVTLHSLDGPWDAFVVLFERVAPTRTAVTLLRDHEPEKGPSPDVAQWVDADLRRFKRHVESAHEVPTAPPLLHGI